MEKLRSIVRVGDRVRIRQEAWRIAEVRGYGHCEIVTVTGLGRTNFGTTKRFIAPFDVIAPADRTPRRLRLVRMPVWRRACRGLLAAAGPVDTLRTAVRARIELLPHQLEPALAVVRGVGCRVLIADAVGLGKTIQAALIASELYARRAVDRVLVVTPAGLRDQWAAELAGRFDLDAVIVDMSAARRRAAELPVGMNPWSTIPLAVASFDYIKRPEVMPAVAACHWDLVIVDEAHGLAPESDRRAAIAAVCARAPYVVLLTATPHSGDRVAFESLCRIGARGDDRLVVFRRSRRDVGAGQERRAHSLRVRPSPAERRMHAQLARLTSAIAAGDREHDAWLAIAVLHKRSFSSASSLEQTLHRRAARTADDVGDDGFQLGLPLGDPAGELDAADEAPRWTYRLDPAAEQRLLPPALDAARAAAIAETKLEALRRLLRRLARFGEAAIVFTEYRDTLARVRQALAVECAVLHGGLTAAERRRELASFTSGQHRILLATDAAGEGLNLHSTCRVVINLELPWNPMRLEQRIGRVDRIGQRRRVHVFHLIAADTGELRVLEYLKARIERARADIDTADPLGGFECDIARTIVGMSASAPGAHGTVVADVRLAAEAARAVAQVHALRALQADPVFPDRPQAAVARNAATRQQLAGRSLVLVHDTLRDDSGRLVGSRLIPLAVSAHVRADGQSGWLQALAAQIEARSIELVDAQWAAAASAIHRAFWTMRRLREEASPDSAGESVRLAQVGLFDRRELRHAADELARAAERDRDSQRRIAAAEAAALLHRSCVLALMLLPGPAG